MSLIFDSEITVNLDRSMMFGLGYDFYGLENLSMCAKGKLGGYRIWPNSNKYSLYRDSDGGFRNDIDTLGEAIELAKKWDTEKISESDLLRASLSEPSASKGEKTGNLYSQNEIDALKAHAVEVLAKALQNRYISMISLGCKTEKDLSMETMRAEARALLGWEE